MADLVRARLIDLLPAVAESVSPPSEGAWDVLGVQDGELGAYGLSPDAPAGRDRRFAGLKEFQSRTASRSEASICWLVDIPGTQ